MIIILRDIWGEVVKSVRVLESNLPTKCCFPSKSPRKIERQDTRSYHRGVQLPN